MVITQSDVARLGHLKGQKEQADVEYRRLRQDLIDLHHRGAVVEPGRWKLSVSARSGRTSSRRSIARALGWAEAGRIEALLPPSDVTTVRVWESGKGGRHGSSSKSND